MTERERCLVCDFPLATENDCRAPFSTDLPSLCWSRFNGDHRGPAIDWRARALEAERALDAAITLRRGWSRTDGARIAELEKELRYLRRHFVCQCDTSYTARDRHAPECMAYELADLDAVLDEVTR